MLKDMKITKKFPLVMISFALLSAITTGIIAYSQAAKAMQNQAKLKLASLLESRESALKHYFNTIEQDLAYHSQSELVINAMERFEAAWRMLPDDKTGYLQKHYIQNNPYKKGQKGSLIKAQDNTEYSAVHNEIHTRFSSLISARSFYDLLLIDRSGNIIYTVIKEIDFATNIIDGELSNSGLADIFKKISARPVIGKTEFSDFYFYPPSENQIASFIGAAIYNENHQFLGVLAFQLPIEQLNSIMQVTAGMGESGKTYLVGNDNTMRSDSRFFSGRNILKRKVDTASVTNAINGKEGVQMILDYRNISVYSAYRPFDVFGVRWAMLAEIDEDEVLLRVKELNKLLMISGVIIAFSIAILGYLLAFDLSHPITTMTNAMNKLASNDLSVNISVYERKDEVGSMASALIQFKNFAIEREKLRERLSHMANHDTLTGLPNRDLAMEHLKKLLKNAEDDNSSVAVMFADLDGFKIINDKHGHEMGDKVIKEVSTRFEYCLRAGDMVARIGGDEFLIIAPDISNLNECGRLAQKIIDIVSTPLILDGTHLEIGVSIGIAIFPSNAVEVQQLLKEADNAMYQAKTHGKNSYVYQDNINRQEGSA